MSKCRWASIGDLNAFFALMLDNVLNLVILTAILKGFNYPSEFIFKFMIPGTAIGVFLGDVVYSFMAYRLAKRTNRNDVTAMPLGLDTPSTIGIALVVLGPVWLETKDAMLTWQVGMATMVLIGIVKVICSFFGDTIRRCVPDAGLIGSLAGVGIALLAFLPLFHVFKTPVVGFIALGLVMYSLIAKIELPFKIPGAFAAVVLGAVFWHVLGNFHLLGAPYSGVKLELQPGWPLPTLGFLRGFSKALNFLPIAIPFGILTIIGGINVTESAKLAGDEYKTRDILLTEAIATLVAGILGGVSQSTPYIGHPAYKAMGAKAAYVLAVGIFVGLGGCLGYIQMIVDIIPLAAVTPILVFIGLEIVNQAYHKCPARHASAVGFALLPCIAELVRIIVTGHLYISENLLNTLPASVGIDALSNFRLIEILGRGFILTAMFWGAATALMIDKKLSSASVYFLICALFTSFGLIHSTAANGALFWPWHVPNPSTHFLAAGYVCVSAMLIVLSWFRKDATLDAV